MTTAFQPGSFQEDPLSFQIDGSGVIPAVYSETAGASFSLDAVIVPATAVVEEPVGMLRKAPRHVRVDLEPMRDTAHLAFARVVAEVGELNVTATLFQVRGKARLAFLAAQVVYESRPSGMRSGERVGRMVVRTDQRVFLPSLMERERQVEPTTEAAVFSYLAPVRGRDYVGRVRVKAIKNPTEDELMWMLLKS